ncbi:shikimate dehydrogenase (NADP(+)) [Sinisalibacter aestuarii]|uniref:Shikimate dehydrogenase (NADP(+)) n=2 Tax=Sinisalibacter aestuarii TaxID=2949426 RepID=A0ABQ5LQ23_9RHOB|nr:shikimate dehydrogenase (NADP(+)) [Sinisalibacter aestuarii]
MAFSLASNSRVSAVPDSGAPMRVGLIGKGIQLSRTPSMHVAEGRAQGLALQYDLIDPDALPGPEPALAEMLDAAEAAGFAGVNVTFPYKRAVIDHLDVLSDAAQKVGAVNTVVFRDGGRSGHNTDFWGFAESVRQGLSGAPMETVLLLGAGGAGGAVAHALKSLNVARLMIFDTDRAAAETLAADVGAEAVSDLARAAARADGIVNATPMGMAKLPGTAIPVELIDPGHWVADIVYFPLETELLRAARAKGCRTLDGSGMAVFQAVRAFSLFTGLTPDANRMRATFEAFSAPETTKTQQGG